MRSMSMTTTITQPPSTRILYLVPTEEKSSKKPKRKVVWAEDTVDNENLNRLKSNSLIHFLFFLSVFCIYNYDINLFLPPLYSRKYINCFTSICM